MTGLGRNAEFEYAAHSYHSSSSASRRITHCASASLTTAPSPDQPAMATLQHIALGEAHAEQTRDTVALKLAAKQISGAQMMLLALIRPSEPCISGIK